MKDTPGISFRRSKVTESSVDDRKETATYKLCGIEFEVYPLAKLLTANEIERGYCYVHFKA